MEKKERIALLIALDLISVTGFITCVAFIEITGVPLFWTAITFGFITIILFLILLDLTSDFCPFYILSHIVIDCPSLS